MSKKKILLIILAAFLVLGGIMALRPQKPAPTAAVKADVQVLVAARNLPAGTLIKDADLVWKIWPKESSTENLIIRDGDAKHGMAGAVVRVGLKAGEAVTSSRLLMAGEQGFLSAVLDSGMRAISIHVTPVTGIAGLVFPGDRVDVILTHIVKTGGSDDTNQHRVSETVIENVRVLALDQKIDDQTKEAKLADVVTLEVTPKDAEKVVLMAEWGTMALSLRGVTSTSEDSVKKPQSETVDGIPLNIPETLEPRKKSYTWDSDVSAVLPNPIADRVINASQQVRILRGPTSGEAKFNEGPSK